MEFNIKTFNRKWFVYVDEHNNSDHYVADLLNIPYNEYEELLIKYGAFKKNYSGYYFGSKQAIENFLNSDELLPLITLAKLTE